jgi:hypothetical protein
MPERRVVALCAFEFCDVAWRRELLGLPQGLPVCFSRMMLHCAKYAKNMFFLAETTAKSAFCHIPDIFPGVCGELIFC